MNHVISATQARRDFLQLIDQVDTHYTRIDVTKNGAVKATLVSPDYLDALEETIYTLNHSKQDIARAEKEIAQGNVVTLSELKSDLQKRKHGSA